MIKYKSAREIALMREAGRLVAEALSLAETLVRPGVTTGAIDGEMEKFVRAREGTLLFKGYKGFPASICASVNEEVVHGIPGQRVLLEGDVVSIDCGVRLHGYCSDSAVTLPVGRVSPAAGLLQVTRSALEAGIAAMGPGRRLSEVSAAVQDHAESRGYSVVRSLVGHGIGTALHEEPQVPNFVSRGRGAFDMVLRPGLVLAVEPMLNAGTHEVELLPNHWTYVTRDRALSAHFEHTVAIRENGAEVLTLP